MKTKDIKKLMLLEDPTFSKTSVYLSCEDCDGYYLNVVAKPKDSNFVVELYGYYGKRSLTDNQYNMICKHVEKEFNEYHSNNTGFTSDDREHFNSLIN